jgi:hypothetical protein
MQEYGDATGEKSADALTVKRKVFVSSWVVLVLRPKSRRSDRMNLIIMVFLSLAVVVLNAYADEKVANKPNFAMAINQYFQAYPTCIEIPVSEQYKFPTTISGFTI